MPGITLIDAHIGDRVRQRRILVGMSQTDLADAIGVSFQQVQKYEQGSNRIGAGLLLRFSELLGVEVAYFYDRLPKGASRRTVTRPRRKSAKAAEAERVDPMTRREALMLVRAYFRIASPEVRQSVFKTVTELARM